MSDLGKIKLSKIISSCSFWMVIFVLYMTTIQGFSLGETYSLLGLFSIAIVLFEYPTGVIGDHFSHKWSVILGYLLYSGAALAASFSGGFSYYAVVLFFTALAISLLSGSDTAFLHYASKNFKKDSSEVRIYSIGMSVISISVGVFLFSINPSAPFYVTALFLFVSAMILLTTKNQKRDSFSGNIFARSSEGLRHVNDNKILFHTIIVSSVFGAFFLSFKWFYNPLLIDLGVEVVHWGWIISSITLLIAVGTYLYKKSLSENLFLPFFLIILTTFLIGFTNFFAISMIALVASQFIRGYIDTQLEVRLNDAISISSRASILSLKSLLVRLFSALYIFGVGFILEKTSFLVLMSMTAFLLFSFCIVSVMKIISRKKGVFC